ncbi:UDP-3-O-(3-hydroxymyristoyl)glucosamine N-acyltransferase [Deferribacter autotrophicus]|uniref:UDP-3-O-acylglucosamine N-acyltransferase n=2 Tax=Deferribacter autotrophicus TaxID=500465 RepID=A0A5A8F5E2_9BACT|nr:UDP-3-O-(3-hydroxymyristoyl)glucosamine N-acyltransferase [Deferribacter autotrophicus]
MKLSEIAKALNSKLVGEDIYIEDVTSIDAERKNSVTFVSKKAHIDIFNKGDFSAAVIEESLRGESIEKPHIFVSDIKWALKTVIDLFYPDEKICHYISETAVIGDVEIKEPVHIGSFVVLGDGTKIGVNTKIEHGCVIGKNVIIGKNCLIYPNVTIYDNVVIGDNVIVHSGTVIGSDGFGYVNTSKGHFKIKQVGSVVIENNVEIGANCTIDRGTLNDTVIGEGTKIDNLVQIGHNVRIGKHCILVAQAAVAGSSNIGDFVIIGGQSGVADHVNIPSGTIIASRAGVPGNIKKPGIYSGSPVMEHKKWLKTQVILKNIEKYIGKEREG